MVQQRVKSKFSMSWIVPGVAVLALVVVFVLWFRSDNQRLHHLVDDLRAERGVVSSVVVNDEGIREVRFDKGATVPEIDAVWERLDDAGVDRVVIGEVFVDPFDMDHYMDGVTPVALAVAGVQTGGPSVEVRWVSSDGWLSVGFSNVLVGADEPTPSDGAFAVLRLLEALDPDDLPDDLDVVVAHRSGEQLDLVSIDRVALERLPDTIRQLRSVAATEPNSGIACDAEGCHLRD